MDYYKKDHKRMRLILVLLLSLIACGLVTGVESHMDPYAFENVDLDAIFNSDRLFNQYMDCILDKGICNADGHYLKHVLPEAVATTCENCNAKQRQMARKMGNFLKHNKPKSWAAFLEKYDPDEKYSSAFEKFLAQVEE